MNLEIKEKFNNFVKIIENKEKMEWLKQINITKEKNQQFQENQELMSFNKNDHKNNYKNNCSCPISSGYDSESESKSELNKMSNDVNFINDDNKFKSTNRSKSMDNCDKSSNKINMLNSNSIKTKNSSSNKYDELSLLEDDYFIGIEKNSKTSNNNLFNDKNSESNKLTSDTIGSEFQNIFLINNDLTKIKKIKKNESSEIKNNLENIYNKIIIKNPPQNKLHGYKISEYINLNKLETKNRIDNGIKKISELIEYIFNESTRGWNYEHNIYILQLEKLKENFEKVIFSNNINEPCKNLIKLGFIYRNFNEPKVYLDKDFTKHWIGFNIDSNSPNSSNGLINLKKMVQTKYQIKDKILFYCLKNLTKSNKFKKKISKISYKFIKKTVQIYGNKDLIVDIILFVGIENI